MKKIYYLLLLAVLPIMATSFSSCKNDEETVNVEFSLDIDENTAKVVDGVIYVEKGTTLIVNDVKVKNLESSKTAVINYVTFYADAFRESHTITFPPFKCDFPTTVAEIGRHYIMITCQLAIEGKSLKYAEVKFPVEVVEKAVPNGTNTISSSSALTKNK